MVRVFTHKNRVLGLSVVISACGGQSSEPGLNEVVSIVQQQTSAEPDSPSINEKNFVSLASLMYTNVLANILMLSVGPSSSAQLLSFRESFSETKDCGVSGKEIHTLAHKGSEHSVNVGGTNRVEYRACEGSYNTKDGFYQAVVNKVSGEYTYEKDKNYEIWINFEHDTTASGNFKDAENGRNHLRYNYYERSSSNGKIHYSAVGLGVLQKLAKGLDEVDTQSDNESKGVTLGESAIASNTAIKFKHLAYERSSESLGSFGNSIDTSRWYMEGKPTDPKEPAFLTKTRSQFIVKHQRVEKGDTTEIVEHANGSWEVSWESGERVLIACDFENGCIISLKDKNSSESRYQKQMSWEKFRNSLVLF